MMQPPPGKRPGDDHPPVPREREEPRAHTQAQRTQPQGAMTPAQRAVTPSEEAAFASLETAVGGRQTLVAALATAQLPRDVGQVLGMLSDPLHDHESLARVCALGNVKLPKLLKVFQEAMRARGQVLAHARIAAKLPDVAAAVMDDAVPGWRTCLTCMETGWVTVPATEPGAEDRQEQCEKCKGRGLIYFTPDHETQKTALKIGGILDSGKGGVSLTMLQANTQVNPGDTGNFDRMMEVLDGAIYGTGRDRLSRHHDRTAAVADAELVENDRD